MVVMGPTSTSGRRNGWLNPIAIDWFIVLALAIVSVPGVVSSAELNDNQPWLGGVLSVLLIAPLLVRRRWPFAVFAAMSAVAFLQWLLDVHILADIGLLVAFYTVVVTESWRRIVIAALVLQAGIVLALAQWAGASLVADWIFLSGLAIAAGALGANSRTRRLYLQALEDRAAQLEREREQQSALAVASERTRIAREMHDIVAHNLTVMITLADAAAMTEPTSQAAEPMQAIAKTGRQAMAEMRSVLGVLRDESGAASMIPQPGVSQLTYLVAAMKNAGLPVELTTDSAAQYLDAGVQLAVYRIVQESLTNSLRHGGQNTSADVQIGYSDPEVTIVVTDTGSPQPNGVGSNSLGRGVSGMRERARAFNGTLHAGPCQEGGWRVRASLTAPSRIREQA